MPDRIREDKEQMGELLNSIGNVVIKAVPEQWDEIVLGYFKVGEGEIPHIQALYNSRSEEDYIDLTRLVWDREDVGEILAEFGKLSEKIYGICEEKGDSWSTMSIVIKHDGRFSVHYGYDYIENFDYNFVLNWQSQFLDL